MTQPNVTELPVPDISGQVGVGIQAVAENAKALGMTWDLRLATVISSVNTSVKVTFDGDDAIISAISMVGLVSVGQRVYVVVTPPSGNFIVGTTALTGAWTPWIPTLSNITQGSGGVITARYEQIGKTVHWFFNFTLGTGSAIGSDPRWSLPVVGTSTWPTGVKGSVMLVDTSAGGFYIALMRASSSQGIPRSVNSALGITALITATVPFTWATGDIIQAEGFYETI